jgi:hypothetical protein
LNWCWFMFYNCLIKYFWGLKTYGLDIFSLQRKCFLWKCYVFKAQSIKPKIVFIPEFCWIPDICVRILQFYRQWNHFLLYDLVFSFGSAHKITVKDRCCSFFILPRPDGPDYLTRQECLKHYPSEQFLHINWSLCL